MKIPKVRMTVEIRFRHDGYELVRDVVRVAVVPILKEFVMVLPRQNLQKNDTVILLLENIVVTRPFHKL